MSLIFFVLKSSKGTCQRICRNVHVCDAYVTRNLGDVYVIRVVCKVGNDVLATMQLFSKHHPESGGFILSFEWYKIQVSEAPSSQF